MPNIYKYNLYNFVISKNNNDIIEITTKGID